jgi:uncharacterized protein YjiK
MKLLAATIAGLASAASAQVTSVNLAEYTMTAVVDLPAAQASEASAVAFNWDTGTLFILGDEGDAIAEVTAAGALVSSMALTGFDDTEGLTYTGNGTFVLVEERLQAAYRFVYTPGASIDRSALPSASLGATVGNVGLEGIAYDPRTGAFIVVKEKTPQLVRQATIDFAAASAVVTDLFTPALGVLDLSDVAVLATVPTLAGTPDQDNLLIFSQESALLLEVSRSGEVLGQFNFAPYSTSAEGVTIDANGVIYICDETPRLFVLTPRVCYPNCDGSTVAPVLNVNDFICFSNRYAAGDPRANCDGSSVAPVLNVNDFVCFSNRYAAGCR